MNVEARGRVDIRVGAQVEELLDQRAPPLALVAFALELLCLALGPEGDKLLEVDALTGPQCPQPSKRLFHQRGLGQGVAGAASGDAASVAPGVMYRVEGHRSRVARRRCGHDLAYFRPERRITALAMTMIGPG